jgi:isopenicillin N synthase-like dioxygenase
MTKSEILHSGSSQHWIHTTTMATTKYTNRAIPQISLANFDSRIDEITKDLISAAEDVGFFCVFDHEISPELVNRTFEDSAAFFGLHESVKSTVPFSANHNAGWEQNSQKRPSTGAPDRKESYQIQFGENMQGRWIDDDLMPGFKARSLEFMRAAQSVSQKLMICFARGLGFPDNFFVECHDVSKADSQTVARLLHYFATPEVTNGEIYHRAGAHTDWDFLTLLFQKAGQSGLEICPGREVSTSFGYGDTWTKVEPDAAANAIICNIGDLLMSWSDDRFKSTFHRVKAPTEPGDYYGERYSIAYFNQPRKSAKIQGPKKRYPLVTGEEFTRNAMQRNFKALLEKTESLAAKTTAFVPVTEVVVA